MTNHFNMAYNTKLIGIASTIVLLCGYALWRVAVETGNWHGMHLSLFHVALVATGTVLALRVRKKTPG